MNALLSLASAYDQLSPSERAFCDAFLRECEAIGATSADVLSHASILALIRRSGGVYERPLVRAAIVEKLSAREAENVISIPKILKEYANIALSNMEDYGKRDPISGVFTPSVDHCTRDQMAAVSSMEVEYLPRGGIKTKFKLYDKLKALDTIVELARLKESDNFYSQLLNSKREQPESYHVSGNVISMAEMYQRKINAQNH